MAQDAALARLEAVTSRLEKLASRIGSGGGGGDDGDDDVEPAYVDEFRQLVDGPLAGVISDLEKAKIPDMGKYLTQAYNNVLQIISQFHKCKKPQPQEILGFLSEVQDAIKKADTLAFKGKNKKDLKRNMDAYKALKECITVCAWPTVAPPAGLPLSHVTTQVDAASFNLNRVLKNTKDENVKNMVKTVKVFNLKVTEYVKNNFKKGIDWNPQGSELSKDNANKAAPAKKVEKAESKNDDKKEDNNNKKKGGTADVKALFGELNKGTDITGGLKKVKKSQKNKYKTGKDKVQGKVTTTEKKSSRKKFGDASSKLKGGRWVAENYNEGIITIDKATIKNSVYVAVGDNATFDIQGKVKSLTVDDCRKCRVFIDEVVSTIEIVNCRSLTVVCRGAVNSISIDKSESVNVILQKKAFENNPDIYTSNISATNIEVPDVNNDKEMKEYPVPEQFLFKIDPKTGKYTIKATEH